MGRAEDLGSVLVDSGKSALSKTLSKRNAAVSETSTADSLILTSGLIPVLRTMIDIPAVVVDFEMKRKAASTMPSAVRTATNANRGETMTRAVARASCEKVASFMAEEAGAQGVEDSLMQVKGDFEVAELLDFLTAVVVASTMGGEVASEGARISGVVGAENSAVELKGTEDC